MSLVARLVLPFCLLVATATRADDPRPGPWPPRGYACPRATVPIGIDGRLDDVAWSTAPWTTDFVDIEGDRRPLPRRRTRAKMAWDDTYFYFAADLEEPDLWATLHARDSVIYHDNDFEVFVDPDGDSHLYTEIELNVFDTVWDLLLVKPYRDGGPAIHAWDIPGLLTAVRAMGTINDPSDTDTGWSVEIAVPWTAFAETTEAPCPPAIGDRWRVNFSRVQWRLDVVDGGYRKRTDPATGAALPEDNWVWSPQREIAMHEPEHWGIVEFRAAPGGPSVLPSTADAAAWHLRWLSYRLAAANRDEDGSTVEFDVGAPHPEGPSLDPEWSWPPRLLAGPTGATWVLESTDGARALVLHPDGRLVSRP